MGDRLSQSASVSGTPDYLNSYTYDADQNLTVVQQQQQAGPNQPLEASPAWRRATAAKRRQPVQVPCD